MTTLCVCRGNVTTSSCSRSYLTTISVFLVLKEIKNVWMILKVRQLPWWGWCSPWAPNCERAIHWTCENMQTLGKHFLCWSGHNNVTERVIYGTGLPIPKLAKKQANLLHIHTYNQYGWSFWNHMTCIQGLNSPPLKSQNLCTSYNGNLPEKNC